MRVRAIATASPEANAIGSVELECGPSGLSIGLYGVGAYQDGYAPGPLTQGTRITVPYSAITRVVTAPDGLWLDLSWPGFPHDRLHLTRFSAGPGVPLEELRRRRLILHVVSGSLAVSAAVAAAAVSPALPTEIVGAGALAYALLAGAGTLGLGFALDRQFFTRPRGPRPFRTRLHAISRPTSPACRSNREASYRHGGPSNPRSLAGSRAPLPWLGWSSPPWC